MTVSSRAARPERVLEDLGCDRIVRAASNAQRPDQRRRGNQADDLAFEHGHAVARGFTRDHIEHAMDRGLPGNWSD